MIDPFSGKPIFGRKKKKFFRKFFSYFRFRFYAREKSFKYFGGSSYLVGKVFKYKYIEFFAFDYDSLPISFQSGITFFL